jgi:O-antigen/teichoic acid export membrane protein
MKHEERFNHLLKTFAKSSLIILFGVFLSKIFTYLYKGAIARAFNPEVYGMFSLAVIVAGVFLSFSSLGLQNGILRYIAFYRGKDKKDRITYLFRIALSVVIPFSIVAGVIMFLTSDLIATSIFHNPNLSIFLKWFALFIPLSSIGGLFHVAIQAYEKVSWYSFIGNILVTSVQLIFLFIFLFFDLKNLAVIFSYLLGALSVFIVSWLVCKVKISELFIKPRLEKKIKKELIKKLFSYSCPIMFFGFAVFVFSWIDSFMIGYFQTISDVGIYNAAITLSLLLGVIPSLFLQFFIPVITREYSKGNFSLIKDLSKQVNKWIFLLNLPLLIILLFFPGAVLNVLFGSDYLGAKNVLRLLSIGVFTYYLSSISENILLVIEKSKITLLNLIIASTLNVCLNFLFIPKYGINGAAFATMISYFAWSLLLIISAKKHASIIPFKLKMVKIFFVSLIPIGVVFAIKSFINMTTLAAILLGILFILLYVLSILITKCLDKNDIMIINTIKEKFVAKKIS